MPRAASAQPSMPGTMPMTSSESSTGPSDPTADEARPEAGAAGADTSACTRLALLSHDPAAHRQPVTDSETPASAVEASVGLHEHEGDEPGRRP